MLTANSPPFVKRVLENMINSHVYAFRIIHRWTVDLRQSLSQRLIDIRYGLLASVVMTKSLKHLARLVSYLSNTALANTAALGSIRYNKNLKEDSMLEEEPILVSILSYCTMLVLIGSIVVVVVLSFMLFYLATCPLWFPIWFGWP